MCSNRLFLTALCNTIPLKTLEALINILLDFFIQAVLGLFNIKSIETSKQQNIFNVRVCGRPGNDKCRFNLSAVILFQPQKNL